MKCEQSELTSVERMYHETQKLHLRCYDVFRYAVLDAVAGCRGLFRFRYLLAEPVQHLRAVFRPVRIGRLCRRGTLRHSRRRNQSHRWNRFRGGRWRGMFARSGFGIILRSVSRHFRIRLRTVLRPSPVVLSSRR